MTRDDIPTPAVIIDDTIARQNIAKAAELAHSHGKKLRPHAKTHKMGRFARMQIEAGAVGICTAKISEAEVMFASGITDILIANEIVGNDKLERLVNLAKQCEVSVLVDSFESLDMLVSAVKGKGISIGVYVEVDFGDRRCGTSPDKVLDIVRAILSYTCLRFCGIETFGGFLFHGKSIDDEMRQCRRLAAGLAECLGNLERAGIEVPEVSVGGSPSFKYLLDLDAVTEVRPGVYVFNDAATVSRGAAGIEDCALTVISTVISISEDRSYAVLDGGAKTFSYCCPGIVFGNKILHGVLKEQPDVCLSNLSEEHGILDISGFCRRADLKIGDRLEIIPSHACPVINLTDWVYLADGNEILAKEFVEGRGKVE